MKIITITLNPAFDLHYTMKSFELYKENYVDNIQISTGGKGVNITRALQNNHIKSTAYVVLGKENALEFSAGLTADGLNFVGIQCEGRIRENITIHSPNTPETRISLNNFRLNNEVLEEVLNTIKREAGSDTIIAFSGRIPQGITKNSIIEFLKELKATGSLLAVDSNSFSIEDYLQIKPWLIKPNESEIESLLGKKIASLEEARKAAIELQKMGISIVIISMGKEGAVAATSNENGILLVPNINPVSTIGAGDSLIAGFIGAYAGKATIEDCLITAVSYGTAACLTNGTAPPEESDIHWIKSKVQWKHE